MVSWVVSRQASTGSPHLQFKVEERAQVDAGTSLDAAGQ